MAQARGASFEEPPSGAGLATKPTRLQLLLLRHKSSRREGSLAAALVQSMALAVISTAGAYPSWVLVTNAKLQVVLGASWAINQADPPRNSALLGPVGGALMMAIAFCCLLSVVTGSSAIGWDFLGRRKCRRLGPVLHCLTALLITSSAALGSTLLGLVRGRTQTVPELQPLQFSATPGQSLFLSFLAGALASTATGLSCSSPALVAPARSSRDLGRAAARRRFSSDTSEESPGASPRYFSWEDDGFFDPLGLETSSSQTAGRPDERPGPVEWYRYLRQELVQTSWQDRWWGRQPPQQPAHGEEEHYSGQRQEEEERAPEKRWEPQSLPQRGIQRELALQHLMEDAIHTRQQEGKETDWEDPGRGDAELRLFLASESQRVKSGEKTSQTSESKTVESQEREEQDFPNIAI